MKFYEEIVDIKYFKSSKSKYISVRDFFCIPSFVLVNLFNHLFSKI